MILASQWINKLPWLKTKTVKMAWVLYNSMTTLQQQNYHSR